MNPTTTPTTPEPDRPYTQHPAVLAQHTLRGVLVLGPDADEPVLLTQPGDLVWEQFAQRRTCSEVVAELSAQFDAPAAVIKRDIAALVRELVAHGLIVESGPAEIDDTSRPTPT